MCKLTTGIFLEAIMAIWSEGDDQLFTGTDTNMLVPHVGINLGRRFEVDPIVRTVVGLN